jgi:tRNA-splicing ligase RtcB (3'-phosphate/5'-hydroxy nucleic acid ligase)
MTLTILKGDRVPIKIWAGLGALESEAIDQLKNVAKLPWVHSHVAAMPDVHAGIGATVGSVIAMKGAVAPAAVGVDIGCGMAAVRSSITASRLPDSLHDLRMAVERAIPVGFHEHASPVSWIPAKVLFAGFKDLDPRTRGLESKAMRQLGTLGSGNHFIELCLDEDQRVWVMLHSGSRNIGKELAEAHIAKAKQLPCNAHLPDRNLAVFLEGSPEFDAYQHDLFWAQAYARENRAVMLHLFKTVLAGFFPEITFDQAITCHHNYVAAEEHFGERVFVTRKGAIRARKDDMGIIPGSMGTKSYIVRGLGEADSFESASHGAGRRMSRSKAKKTFSAADVLSQTKNVECRKDTGVIDELPGAYKDIDEVMENQRDLVEAVHTLKQVMCVKG